MTPTTTPEENTVTRTIRTAAELDALPVWAVVEDVLGIAWVRHPGTPDRTDHWVSYYGDRLSAQYVAAESPLTVLHDPSAPVLVVSDAAVETVVRTIEDHAGPLGDPDEGTVCDCGVIVAPAGVYGVWPWREHRARAVLDAVRPLLGAAPSATREGVEHIARSLAETTALIGADARLVVQAAWALSGPSATREATETITIPRPHVPHGPAGVSRDDSDAEYLREAARDLEGFYKPFGANLRATVVGLLRDAADAITPRADR